MSSGNKTENEYQTTEETVKNENDVTCKEVSVGVDCIFLISFVLVIVVLTLAFTLYSSVNA